MELCKGGELYDAILKRKRYPEQDAARVMFSVLSAMQFMHSKGFVHRDLKPENVIPVGQDSFTNVRVVDFGQAEQILPGEAWFLVTGYWLLVNDGLRLFTMTDDFRTTTCYERIPFSNPLIIRNARMLYTWCRFAQEVC